MNHRAVALCMAIALAVLGLAAAAPSARAELNSKKPPREFISWVVPMAQRGERDFGVPTSVAIAQAILESGWGGSRLTREANSFFGIKCHKRTSPYQNGCYEIETREYDAAGNPRVEVARFRSYATPADSFLDHGHFLRNNSRYRAAFDHQTNPERFIHEVHKAGYATDPGYASLVIQIMHQYDLKQYDLSKHSTRPLAPSVFGKLDRSAKVGTTQKFIVSVHGDPDGRISWQVSRNGHDWSEVHGASVARVYKSTYERRLTAADNGLRIRAVVSSSGGTASVEGRLKVAGGTSVMEPIRTAIVRHGGADRYEVAVNISRARHRDGAGVAVHVASGEAFPDALTGAAVAAKDGGVLLLVEKNQIPDVVKKELRRLAPSRISVQGGYGVVSEQVLRELRAITGATVHRNGGADRYEVAIATARHAFPKGADTVFLAKGSDFPDALSAATLFSRHKGPVLLTTTQRGMEAPTLQAMRDLRVKRVFVLGGTGAVPERDVTALRRMGVEVTRLGGPDRYEVSLAAAQHQFPKGSETVYIATGKQFPDGLALGPLVATEPGPLLLVPTHCVPNSIVEHLRAHPPRRIVIAGGHAAVTANVEILRPCSSASPGGLPTEHQGHTDDGDPDGDPLAEAGPRPESQQTDLDGDEWAHGQAEEGDEGGALTSQEPVLEEVHGDVDDHTQDEQGQQGGGREDGTEQGLDQRPDEEG